MAPEFTSANRLQLLCCGGEYFPALEAAISGARSQIYLETYLFEIDSTGTRISAALCDAAARGVNVRLLIDGFGASHVPPTAYAGLRSAGVELLRFGPRISPWTLRRHRLRRLHRKLVVIDGRIAFIGGINIIDDQHRVGRAPEGLPPRHDYAVMVEGPVLAAMHASVAQLWRRVQWTHTLQRPPQDGHPVTTLACGQQRAAFVQRDNLNHRDDIEQAYLAAIRAAHDEILIASAYFFPGRRFRQALRDAAARGVRVVLLLQGRIEFVLLHYAARALYSSLFAAGVEIHEYHKSYLHAKVAVIDQRWATVGSSNIDPFSLLLAREANLVIDDSAFAAQLRQSLLATLADGARHVAPAHWLRQSLWRRIPIWVGYGIVRFLLGMVGYADCP